MFQRAAGATVTAVGFLAAFGAASASAEIARPPGANPSDRGYELVTLPDSGAIDMNVGTAFRNAVELSESYRIKRPSYRLPAVSSGGGAAIVSGSFPIYGQPSRGPISVYRSIRQPSGVWTQTFAYSPQQPQPSSGLPEAWTPNFGTVLWTTDDPVGDKALSADGRTLTYATDREPNQADGAPRGDIYQRADGGPDRRVNETTGGTAIDDAALQEVSPDGARVAFSADDGSGSGSRIYLRDGATTYAVDTPRQPLSAPRTTSQFVGGTPDYRTTPDLHTVFFLTLDRLVAGDTNDSADLYRWTESNNDLQLVSSGTSPVCPNALPNGQLKRGRFGGPEGCDVAFAGQSPDGRRVYFLSPGRLGGATGAEPGLPNLYVRDGQGPIRFVLTFSAGTGSNLAPVIDATFKTGGIEPDGSFLSETLRDPVTGQSYDTQQVVRVDPQTLKPVCISCDADGGSTGEGYVHRSRGSESAATNTTADGQHVFFTSKARLVAADRNSVSDVYDYDVATGERTLVSAGRSSDDSFFAGMSADGTDVMISTLDTLVGRDHNGPVPKIYDARRGGGEQAPTSPSAPCGAGCRPFPPAPPPGGETASSLAGPSEGNVPRASAVRLAVGLVSAAQRRAFARDARLVLTVRTSAAATVRATARATLGRTRAIVGSGSVRLSRSGRGTVRLRLSRAARRALKAHKSVRLSVAVTVAGESASKTVSLLLRAASGTKAGAR